MGVLSIRLKPNFMGLLKILNNFNWFIVFFSLINLSVCIYEDQIGKFDWRQSYVGRIKFAQFDTVSTAKKIIVATEENVLAALNLKTGQVVWRHVFETTPSGNINLLHVGEKVVTVTGDNPYLVRGWDSTTGVLQWEWSLTLQNDAAADLSQWWVQNNVLIHMLPVFGSHVEVTVYKLVTGQSRGFTSKLPAVWTNKGCVLSAPYYTCMSGDAGSELLLSMDVTSEAVQIISKPLTNYITSLTNNRGLKPLDGNTVIPGFVIDDKKIILIRNNDFETVDVSLVNKQGSVTIIDSGDGPLVLQAWNDNTKGLTIKASSLSGSEHLSVSGSGVGTAGRALAVPSPRVAAATCSRGSPPACRVLLAGDDDSVHMMQQGGRVLWSREEALANVVAAEFVDLPVSDLDAAIEAEFDKEGSIWSAFSRRLSSQLQQLLSLPGLSPSFPPEEGRGGQESLVRDYFNLHKVIVLVTYNGKIFGIDNLSGAILWQRLEPMLEARNVMLLTQRPATHAHDPVLTIVGKHKETGNGYLITLNPIVGSGVGAGAGAGGGEAARGGAVQLAARLVQAALVPEAAADNIRPLVLLDEHEHVQVIPPEAGALVQNMYLYVVNTEPADVIGYALQFDGREVVARRTWRARAGGTVAGAARRRNERVAGVGRVLPDRSVLYKYSNPNLLLLLTHRTDSPTRDLVAMVIDVVSGNIVYSQQHKRARATGLALHTDNYIAYVFYNEKHRRYEIATLELYAGTERGGAVFSSLAACAPPRAAAAGFVLGAAPRAAAATTTERAITDKHVLLALSTGAIVEIPWAYLEPRGAEGGGEEGALPYSPDVPLPAEATINYNTTLHRIQHIFTAPSSLESTSLVLATGLDLYYTRVAPSKTFDLLKDDFDYYLITIVLIALIVATYSTKYFASRKLLKQGWK